jgi:exodeoxyribonuclease-3
MMRIATWNVNGIRAACRKGLRDQISRLAPDVVLLQEVRATREQAIEALSLDDGWHAHWHPAVKPGYSGTAVLSTQPMKVESVGLRGAESDTEGRLIVARVGPARVVSVYLPSGSSGEHRQAEKDRWLAEFAPWCEGLVRSRVPTVLGGDFNIAHTERDIYYAKANEGTSGFLPHERAWMGSLLDSGWHDAVRAEAGDCAGPYSWWSARGNARALDRGWRIDYVLGNKAAEKRAGRAWIDREAGLAISDHAPVLIELDV